MVHQVRFDSPRIGPETGLTDILSSLNSVATCANLGLYSLFAPGTFDLVVAGPNYGRNTSTAFALSSGTIGSAMSASITGVPAIALSFGLMEGYKPPGDAIVDGALSSSCKVIKQLWELGWGQEGPERVDLYSVNVPVSTSRLPSSFVQILMYDHFSSSLR